MHCFAGNEPVPLQADGEAWLQPPGVIKIEHKNRVQMLARDRVSIETSSFFFNFIDLALYNFEIIASKLNGSDYFTKIFMSKENKNKMRNIHPRIIHLLFQGLRLGFELVFGSG